MLRLSLCLPIALLLLPACEENLDPATPEGALHQLRDALLQKDADAVLGHTSAATQARLAELHTLLKEQRAAIAERYPDEHRPVARTAYPDGVLAAKDTGALFAALVAPGLDALEASDGLRHGLTASGPAQVQGTTAKVVTQAGETIEFVLEDDRWVTTAFERPVSQNLGRARLYQQTLTENLKVFEEMKRRAKAKKARAKDGAPPSGAAPASKGASGRSP